MGIKSLLARQLWKKQQAKEASIRKVVNSNELIVSTNLYGTLSTPLTSPSLLSHSPIPPLAPKMAYNPFQSHLLSLGRSPSIMIDDMQLKCQVGGAANKAQP